MMEYDKIIDNENEYFYFALRLYFLQAFIFNQNRAAKFRKQVCSKTNFILNLNLRTEFYIS